MTENALVKAGFDVSDLTPQEQAQLAELYKTELQASREGVDLQPIVFTINKDSCTFMDPFGNGHSELRGVIVFKHKTRGYWEQGSDDNVPDCRSWDGDIGITTETDEQHNCASCPHNAWGTGWDEAGNPTRGKACKERRRLFIAIKEYHLPIMISIPPASLSNFDSYISARLTRGIPDIAAETIITLSPVNRGKKSYAVTQFRMGDMVEPRKMLELNQLRTSIAEIARAIEIDSYYPDSDADTTDDMSNAEPF